MILFYYFNFKIQKKIAIANECESSSYDLAEDPANTNPTSICIKNDKVYVLNANSNAYTSVITLENGINVLKIDDVNIKQENLLEAVTDATKLAIYDCKDSECKQTYGYVYDTTKYIKVSHDSESEAVTPITDDIESETDCSGNIGNLIQSSGKVYLCLASDKSIELKTTGTSDNYFMTNVENNIFSNANSNTYSNLVIKGSNNALTFNNAYTGK